MENNKPIVTIDKKYEKKANKEYSHFFEEKIILTKKVGEILKKLNYDVSKQYIVTYEGEWVPSHKQIYVADTENENILRLTFDILLGYKTISVENFKNEHNNTIKLTNVYYYNKTNDGDFELTLNGYRKNIIKITQNKTEQIGFYEIQNYANLFRIYNFLNSDFDYVLYFEKENDGKLTLDKETEIRISNEILGLTKPNEFIKTINNIVDILKEMLKDGSSLIISIRTKKEQSYGKIQIENGKLVKALMPITGDKKYIFENKKNKEDLKEDLKALEDETDAVKIAIARREKYKIRTRN